LQLSGPANPRPAQVKRVRERFDGHGHGLAEEHRNPRVSRRIIGEFEIGPEDADEVRRHAQAPAQHLIELVKQPRISDEVAGVLTSDRPRELSQRQGRLAVNASDDHDRDLAIWRE